MSLHKTHFLLLSFPVILRQYLIMWDFWGFVMPSTEM